MTDREYWETPDKPGTPAVPRHPMIICGAMRTRVDYLLSLARALGGGPELTQLEALNSLMNELEWSLTDGSWMGKTR